MDFTIIELEREPSTGVVKTCHWVAAKQDGQYAASECGSVNFDKPDPATFIDFESVSQETVKKWFAEKLNMQQLESRLKHQIDAQKNPNVAFGLPWSSQNSAQIA